MDSKDKIIVALAEMGEYRASSCYRAAVDLLSAMVAHYEGQFSAGKLPADRLLEIATAARQCRLIRQSLIDGQGAIAPTL